MFILFRSFDSLELSTQIQKQNETPIYPQFIFFYFYLFIFLYVYIFLCILMFLSLDSFTEY